MTEVIVLGEESPKKEKKRIEFVKSLNQNGSGADWAEAQYGPSNWRVVELIQKTEDDKLDVMYAYDENRNIGILYLGHFNDGVV
jgi:hypothetical protein